MPALVYILMIPLMPLIAFVLLGAPGRGAFRKSAGVIASLAMLVSAAMALMLAWGYFFSWGQEGGVYQRFIPMRLTWLPISRDLVIDMGIILDPVSVMMLVVITFISLMVNVYSISYMKGEERYNIFFSFLSLFSFSMLGLVMSLNMFQMYIFWELVGVSSFLLIGYYYHRATAVAAAKKAFIVTRFADLGLLIGILIVSSKANSLDIVGLIERFGNTKASLVHTALGGWSLFTTGMLLIFAGGAGKSAMFPLHIWLPDAMEGPTPVSALIHAATMVVAGVFLVARFFPVYYFSAPEVLQVIAWVGAGSALFAAIIACTQTDLKRVLAYSTMSQIGFMMFALGVSGYAEQGLGFTASQFHLFTHAFFKALLFLCAGLVIHRVHSNELRDMGGLRKSMPWTHICFLTACLAIAGIPPFAGFFSKEEILLAAYENQPAIFWVGLFTSALTAFYMFRLYFNIFWSKPEYFHGEHKHEGTAWQIIPLVILSAGSAFLGFLPFGNWVTSNGVPMKTELHLMFSIAPVALALAAILLAARLYKNQNELPKRMSVSAGNLYTWAHRKFYIDEIYLFITRRLIMNGIGKPAAWIDKHIVDGLVNRSGTGTLKLAERIKAFQSGKLQSYGLVYLLSVIVTTLIILYFITRN